MELSMMLILYVQLCCYFAVILPPSALETLSMFMLFIFHCFNTL